MQIYKTFEFTYIFKQANSTDLQINEFLYMGRMRAFGAFIGSTIMS